jgi:hypothetical protein
MKPVRRLLSLIIALTMTFGLFGFSAQAKSKAAPLSLNVEVSNFDSGYSGIITVAVTVKNISGKDVKNIVVTSCGSEGLCMYRPIDYNVVITNPGYSMPLAKKDALTTCLKPGGTMKYVYCVLLGYQYAKRLVPEATRNIMLAQHRHLGTKNFREISIKANYVESTGDLTFGDIKTKLDIKAYYNVKSATYKQIVGGSSVTQNPAVRTAGNYSSETAVRSAEKKKSSASSSSANTSSSSGSATAVALSNAVKTATSTSAKTDSSSTAPNKDTIRTYILDTATKTYHSKSCGHWPTANRINRETTAAKLESEGYTLCGFCAG